MIATLAAPRGPEQKEKKGSCWEATAGAEMREKVGCWVRCEPDRRWKAVESRHTREGSWGNGENC